MKKLKEIWNKIKELNNEQWTMILIIGLMMLISLGYMCQHI